MLGLENIGFNLVFYLTGIFGNIQNTFYIAYWSIGLGRTKKSNYYIISETFIKRILVLVTNSDFLIPIS